MAKKIKTSVVRITPALAGRWLKTNINNRPLTESLIDELAAAMKCGEWVFTGEAIRFDSAGNLCDGQHRLHAVVLSGVTIESLVVRGLDNNAFDVIDTGRKRSNADMLSRHQEKYCCILAGALGWLWRYEHQKLDDSGRAIRPRPQQVLKYLGQHPDLRKSVRFVSEQHLYRLSSPSLLAFAHYYACKMHGRKKADAFFGKLSSGENISANMAVYKLRERMLQSRASREQKAPLKQQAAWIIKAWNASLNGNCVGKLTLKTGEKFPEFSRIAK